MRFNFPQFHLLVILADGQLEDEGPTLAALAEASRYPISVLMVGVGDGPWSELRESPTATAETRRKFENYHVRQICGRGREV